MLALHIRTIQDRDATIISQAFAEQGWSKPISQYEQYTKWQAAGIRDVLIAELDGAFAGYLTINWTSHYPAFAAKGIPEIVDLNVLKKYQRKGIASALLDEAEARIEQRSDYAGIGFGVTSDYGAAQILYIKRGYIPDGQGLCRNMETLPYNASVSINDELAFYLTKRLAPKANNYIQKIRQKLGNDKLIYPGVRILIENEAGEFLFIERRDNGQLGLPAGGLEEEETLEDCIRREVWEETGLELLDLQLIGLSSEPDLETVIYPNKDQVQYLSAEFYSNQWRGLLSADPQEVKRLAFRPAKYVADLPANERSTWESLQYFRQTGQVRWR